MLKPIIYPYKMASQSAKKLAGAVNGKRVFPNRNYRPRNNHLVINWGNSTIPNWWMRPWGDVLNHPYHIGIAANKLETFNLFKRSNVAHPNWTTDKGEATTIISSGHKVFCRKTLTEHSGSGIVIASTVDELVDAPLYVQAVKEDKEYRVHVFNGRVIDYQQKKKKNGFEGGISGIRNHANGWVYTRGDVVLPDNVSSESIKAVAALNLDFGAVDVCTDTSGNVFVFEVNTAPGLHGTTLVKYTEAVNEILNR